MHFLKPFAFAALIAASIPLTSAECFPGGATWFNKHAAVYELKEACHKLDGIFKAEQVKVECRDKGGKLGQKYVFEARNQNKYDISLPYDVCVRNLKRQIDYCDRGGWEVFSGMRFKYVRLGAKCGV